MTSSCMRRKTMRNHSLSSSGGDRGQVHVRSDVEHRGQERCVSFGLIDNNSAGCKIGRLLKDHLAEKAETFTENGHRRLSYRKKNSIL